MAGEIIFGYLLYVTVLLWILNPHPKKQHTHPHADQRTKKDKKNDRYRDDDPVEATSSHPAASRRRRPPIAIIVSRRRK